MDNQNPKQLAHTAKKLTQKVHRAERMRRWSLSDRNYRETLSEINEFYPDTIYPKEKENG